MAFKDWSTTANSNDTADAAINWQEGQSPSTVNNSSRAMMAALAVWRDLINYGTVSAGTVGGSANAITLTCSPTVLARTAGRRYLFKYTSTGTTGGVTLVVDSLTSGAIQYKGSALASGDIATSDWVFVVDDGTNFQLLSIARVSTFSATLAALAASQAEQEAASSTAVFTTPGRQHYHPGHPKWWGYVTVSAGAPTLAASYNLTSITDTGTGILTATIANDLSSVNWAPFVTVQRTATTTGDSDNFTCGVRNATIAAGSVAFDCLDQASSQTLADPASWSIFGLGDI